MREIKFRAWDDENKEMVYDPEEIPLFYETDNGFHSGFMFPKGHPKEGDWVSLYLMQYTGLKDKSGKEIYEGDIIRLPIGVEVPIVFKNGSFCVHGYHWENELCEVVGNIHENKELIK